MSTSLIGVSGIENTTPEFREALVRTAEALGIEPDYLATVISFESRFVPDALNRACLAAGSSNCAVGLIQFTSGALQELGVSAAQMKATSAVKQLEYVRRYYARKGFAPGRSHSLDDVYFAVFWPAAIGKPLSTVLLRRDSSTEEARRAYALNKGLDAGGKGYISAGDVSRSIRMHYAAGQDRPRVPVVGGGAASRDRGGGAALVVLTATAAYLYFKNRKNT